MKTPLYFAYGSNLRTARLESRVGLVEKHSNFILEDWKLVFNTGFNQAFANIIPCPGERVEGVLYKLNFQQISDLDGYEGVPWNYQKFYQALPDGEVIYAYISTRKIMVTDKDPDLIYLSHIAIGAESHGLADTLQKINIFTDEVKERAIQEELKKKKSRRKSPAKSENRAGKRKRFKRG